MTTVYAGLGSNLRPEDNLRVAVRDLARQFGPLRLSPVYRNPAIGFEGDDFLNLVVGFDTDQEVAEVVDVFERLHGQAGRTRGGERFVSRTLDIDLLLYGDCIADEPPLPRPDILEYLFVLQPLVDIAPGLRHPQTGRSLRDHLESGEIGHYGMQVVDIGLDEAASQAPRGATSRCCGRRRPR